MKGSTLSIFFALVALSLVGCQKREKPVPAPPPKAEISNEAPVTATSSGNPLAAPVEYLGAVSKAHQSAIKSIDTSSLKQAINMFQADKGRFPKDLNELVSSGTLRKLPPPPPGMEVQYDPATGTVKVVKQ